MKTVWHNFEIESEFVGKENSNWDNNSKDRHHLITVKDTNPESDKSISFNFWTSKANPKITKREELLDALECFFSDAEFGDYGDFYDFCNEMGYNVPRGAYESWKACKAATSDARYMFGSMRWNDVADELREERE